MALALAPSGHPRAHHFGEGGICMTLRWAFFLWFFAATAFGQTPPPSLSSSDQSPAPQASALEVEPGSPVLKQKDLWEGSGVFRPLLRMPKYVLQDQKAIWTSPFHTRNEDVK